MNPRSGKSRKLHSTERDMFETSRRKLLGASMIGAGTVLNGLGAHATAAELNSKGNIMLNTIPDLPQGLIKAAGFPLVEAIHG